MSRVIDYTEERLRENEFSHACWSNCPAGCQRQLVLELQRQVQSFALYMTPSSSPTGGVTGILRLPTEVFCMIVQRLAPLHLVALMLTCRSFYDMLCDVSILYAQNILRLDQADLQRLKHQKPSFKCRVEGKANRIQFFWIGKLKDVQLARWTEDEAVRQRAYEEKFGRVP
ncbi:hypothetical protein FA09DRAFT_340224 [Tilletiopsis washingtonensis]|uniref:F-box domain-containing protein n=1 Tax=Tilletiopsis washingtonensis TaxID=58919 RepID=A0A316Z640_9BASI|nr:hypothetical protein FA09DRAFT_340224 [Tilletiopsis washingtonensis]PWN96428.1 hypothetical protein FA09DRAFT_340224 [Tilletiopsis washingtonensis]